MIGCSCFSSFFSIFFSTVPACGRSWVISYETALKEVANLTTRELAPQRSVTEV